MGACRQDIRASLSDAFRVNKDEQISSIIVETYGDCDVVFIQEAAGAFVEGIAGRRIKDHYHMLQPAVVDGKVRCQKSPAKEPYDAQKRPTDTCTLDDSETRTAWCCCGNSHSKKARL